jgi:hypothetical protein
MFEMNKTIIAGLLALSTVTTPLAAQGNYPQSSQFDRGANWDRDAFWRGSGANPMERIAFMQARIDRGYSDGTLTRRETRMFTRKLNEIRMDAQRMRGNYSPAWRDNLQARLDDLGSQLRWQRREGRDDRYGRIDTPSGNRFTTDYDAARYYRTDSRYQERRLSATDEVYRGSDGRMYCKRSDGTTGLVIGAVGGAVLGNVIDGGHDRAAGTLIGGALGALIGKSIDQNSDVRCR